ncbi:MAG: DUF2065 domain-containing protein [Cellvibrionaceae bacterium]|nr:DUF2065 domain-containing protein [Cellvibrionaceae bacterium]
MWENIANALCLVLIIEGMIPFLYPKKWRKLVETLAAVSSEQLRVMGLISMLLGLACLLLISNS